MRGDRTRVAASPRRGHQSAARASRGQLVDAHAFEREARIVARLRHPAIVTIHDFGVLTSGHAYLVMEYLDDETLRKTILSGAQTVEATLSILRPAGEAVDAAHRAGVVHRDLKPENIMSVKDASASFRAGHAATAPRVLDFGLAKMTGPIGENEQPLVQSGHSARRGRNADAHGEEAGGEGSRAWGVPGRDGMR